MTIFYLICNRTINANVQSISNLALADYYHKLFIQYNQNHYNVRTTTKLHHYLKCNVILKLNKL